jgi:hypothetical protein
MQREKLDYFSGKYLPRAASQLSAGPFLVFRDKK